MLQATLVTMCLLVGLLPDPISDQDQARARLLVESMKRNPRGPYKGVSWFCKDGTMQPPKSGACSQRGGGRQHGVASDDANRLAGLGVYVGSVLAALEPADLTASDLYRARALVIERYLERSQDGWVLSSAKSYRGARQVEDEEASSARLLHALAGDPRLVADKRSLMLRLVRALPYGPAEARTDEIRALATTVGDLDPRFVPTRSKIHSLPEASDVQRVRSYLKGASGDARRAAEALLAKMQRHYSPSHRGDVLKSIQKRIANKPAQAAIEELLSAADPATRVMKGTRLLDVLGSLLNAAPVARRGGHNLRVLYAMGLVEEQLVDLTAALTKVRLTRARSLELVDALLKSGHTVGLLSQRELGAAQEALASVRSRQPRDYAYSVEQLGRALEWAQARHVADFGLPLAKYRAVEPTAYGVIDDLLRSGLVLPLAALLDRLAADVDKMRGGAHRLDGVSPAAVRGENSGFAVGVLRVVSPGADPSGLRKKDIALLTEVGPDLPPVAGIISVGHAGSLSHVSLLAQNLGIPHVAITAEGARHVEAWAGREVALGVSVSRRVLLGRAEQFAQAAASNQARKGTTLRVDAKRLDLQSSGIRLLDAVSEEEAGISVGPKAAELSRLRRLFKDRVSNAAVIPFGSFVRHASQIPPNQSVSALSRLQASYRKSATLDEAAKERFILAELERFRAALQTLPFPSGFEREVEQALKQLGAPGTFGVFVRSDTNVEDLKDFTGAGLNLTVPHRVGLPSTLSAIRAVWASPFSERSYRWRQQLLENPEHVYPSVILHRTIPSEVSGVLVTTDLETGAEGALTISVSEGVAAVVDGGAAETIVLEKSGRVRLLSSSRVFVRRQIPPPPQEGVDIVSAEGRDPLLGPKEIEEVSALAKEILKVMPRPERGVAWDIEFGLIAGKAYLFQIRPLKASRLAASVPILIDLDRAAQLPSGPIDLTAQLP